MSRALLAVLVLAALGQPAEDPQATLARARVEERGVLDQIAEIDQRLIALRGELEARQAETAQAEATLRQHSDAVASASARLERERAEMAGRIDSLYRHERTGLARVVFGAEDPVELRRRNAYLVALARADLARFRTFLATVEERRAASAVVDRDVQALAALRAEIQLKDAELRDQRARQLEALGEIQARRETALRALTEMSDARRDLGARLSGVSAGVSAGTGFREAYGRLPWPTTGRLLRGFGAYVDATTGREAESKGVDISADYGTPVRAVHAGVVSLADYVRGYGQTVAIEHGPYTTVYAHLGGLRVRKGQEVQAADVVGLVGNTGLTDGAGYVLTFEVRYNRTAQDPLAWLGAR